MIIKKMDSRKEEMGELSSLLNGELTPNQRFLIERELKAMRSGAHGEKDSVYYIDFYYENSKNWVVIHDLRLEHEDQVAQIDHILMNRVFDMYVLESKSYSHGIKITPEGEFQAYYGKQCFGIPSPIEQNKRHIHFLDRFLKANDILPKRMGISIKPRFKNLILVSPKCIITRPSEKKFDTSLVIKADTLETKIKKEVDRANPVADIASFSKICSSSTIEEVARKLASFHKPLRVDFRAKFGLPAQGSSNPQNDSLPKNEEPKPQNSSKYFCSKCKKAMSEKVAKFCWQNKSKFGGRAYCFDCQKDF